MKKLISIFILIAVSLYLFFWISSQSRIPIEDRARFAWRVLLGGGTVFNVYSTSGIRIEDGLNDPRWDRNGSKLKGVHIAYGLINGADGDGLTIG